MHVLAFGWQAFFYVVAVVLFVADAFGVRLPAYPRVSLAAAGLAFAFFPQAWNALALA